MPKFSVKKPFTVLVGVILVLVLGAVSLWNMPTDLLPSISLPYLMVVTAYPGASPERVENDVTRPLEAALGTVTGVENVSSTSSENYSMVMLEFADDTDMDSAMVKASTAINQLADSLPDTVTTPTIIEMSPDMLATEYVALDYEGMDIYALSEFAEETVIPAIERVAGVANVTPTGLVEKTVEVTLRQDKINKVNDRLLRKVSERLDEAAEELEDAERELDENEQKLIDGEKELADGQAQLDSGRAELVKGQEELAKTQEETAQQLAELSQQLDEAVATVSAYNMDMTNMKADKAILEGLIQAGQGGEGLDQFLQSPTAAALPNSLKEFIGTGDTEEIQENIDRLKALEQTMKPMAESIPDEKERAQMLAMIEMIDQLTPETVLQLKEAKDNLPHNQANLTELNIKITAMESATAELTTKIDELRTAYKELEAGKITAAAGFGSGSAQLAAGITALDSAQAQLDSTKSQLESGRDQIESGRDQLADARKEYEDAREEALKSANLDQLLNISTLTQLISAQNFSMPAGYIEDDTDPNITYLLKVGEPYASVEELAGTLLVSNDSVGEVRLQDVADVVLTDNAGDSYAKMAGNQAVLLALYKGSTASTSEVSDAANAAMKELEDLHPGLHLTPIMDQGDYIRLIVNSVMSNLLWGAALAIVVLALFLKDLRPTAVVAISIPLSVLFAIVLMYFSGITLNMISLSGLALGIGMLVDNSIVVIENIYRLRARGVPAARAAVQGARQVAGAIIASTLTTVCVFVPIVFTEGLTRQLMMDMALTIGYSLGASLIVALTVVPCSGSTLLRKARDIPHPWFDRVTAAYEKVLRFCLKVKAVPLTLAIVLLAFSVWRVLNMGLVLIPEISSNQVSVNVTMPETNDKETSIATADAVMERILAVDGIESVGAMSASAAGSIMGSLGGGGEDDFTSFIYYIILDEKGDNDQAGVQQAIRDATADLDCEVSVGSGSAMDISALTGSGVEVNIYGNDIDTLMQLSDQVMALMDEIPGITELSNGQEEADTEVRVIVDKDKAMGYGLTVAQVFAELSSALTTESTSTTLTVGADTYTVDIIDTTKTPDLGDIFQHEFTTTATDEDGNQVQETHTLGEFATRLDAPGVNSIDRENQSRYMTVTSTTEEGYNTSLLSRELRGRLAEIETPEGYSVEIAGESTQIDEMLTQMAGMLALAFVMIYLVMVAQFQSLLSPFIVLFTVPLAFTGGMLGLLISGEELSLMSLMGFLVLMGVIVNNGIVFVDYANQLRVGGLDRTTALVATGVTRMRPILMTTLTTVLAMVTMLFSSAPGSEMGRGMAIVIVGGLLYATLMTLFVVPVIYDILFKKQPVNVDVGDDGMDDLPDDAAEFAARYGVGAQPAPALPQADAAAVEEDAFPDFPIEHSKKGGK